MEVILDIVKDHKVCSRNLSKKRKLRLFQNLLLSSLLPQIFWILIPINFLF